MTGCAAEPGPGAVALASGSEAFCRVVTPDAPRWRDLGHKFCVRVREYTRVEPVQLTPDEVTDEDFARYNLVLFGSILDNPALLKLYARGRCFTDASYPGREGAEIRTLLNPLGAGRDVLHIGGSDISAVHEAAIGLNRSFQDVTTEVDGVLFIRRLNFAVAPDHHVATPGPAAVQRALDLAHGDPDALVAQAATFALCHYQTDHHDWADAVRRALVSVVDAYDGSPAAGRLAMAWGLTHASPAYDSRFRDAVDRTLTRAAEASAGRLRKADASAPLCSVLGDCMTVLRVSGHLESARGECPFDADVARAWETVVRPDPGVGDDGFRHWATVDAWLGAVLWAERYDMFDGGILDELALEAVAERDNLGGAIGEPSGRQHAEDVLRKIAAFQDAGEPLWLRRWMQDAGPQHPPGPVPSGWYTGAYAPDGAPTPARDIPRVHVTRGDGPDRDVRSVVFRRDLDAATEYLALAGPDLATRRMTWRGHTWLDDTPTRGAACDRVTVADMDGFAYIGAMAAGSAPAPSRRQIVWRHGQFFLIVDTNRADDAFDTAALPHGVTREAAAQGYVLRAGVSAIHISEARDEGPAAADAPASRVATLLSLGAAVAIDASHTGPYSVGRAICYLGEASVDGAALLAETALFDGDDIWLAGFEALNVDGVAQLTASSPVHMHLSPSRAAGRVVVGSECRLAWNDDADGVDLAAGSYDVQLHDFEWSCLSRLVSR